MSLKNNLSGCVITQNEELVIAKVVKNLSFCNEVVVVDGGSEDKTVSFAEEAGAIVIDSPWRDDFSYQRNVAINNSKGEWVLMLDSDEEISRPLAKKIRELIKNKDVIGYYLPRKNYIDGELVKSDSKYEMQPRLFRRSQKYVGAIHEEPQSAKEFQKVDFDEDEYIKHDKSSGDQKKHLKYQKQIMEDELKKARSAGDSDEVKRLERLLKLWNKWWRDCE